MNRSTKFLKRFKHGMAAIAQEETDKLRALRALKLKTWLDSQPGSVVRGYKNGKVNPPEHILA